MLAGSGAPPPEENPTERKYIFLPPQQTRGPAYWPLISAKPLIEPERITGRMTGRKAITVDGREIRST
jgi:hypothetical protein